MPRVKKDKEEATYIELPQGKFLVLAEKEYDDKIVYVVSDNVKVFKIEKPKEVSEGGFKS